MRKKKPVRPGPAPPPRPPWTESLPLQIAALVLLVWIAYQNSLGGGYHFDDQGIFLDPYIASPGWGGKILRWMQTRPLTFLTFHWNYLAGGRAPEGYHAASVLLHAGNAVLVMLLARQVFRGFVPLFAGALFALHPLQTQAVNYVFERATLLAAFFALISLLLFVRKKYAWSTAAFALSLLAKEETIALPGFLLIYDLARRERIRPGYYAAMFGLAAAAAARLFFVLHRMPGVELGFGAKSATPLAYALTQSRVIWTYLRMFVFPVGLNLDHDVRLSQGILSPPSTLPAVAMLIAVIGALAWLAWHRHEVAVWALGFFVLLSPGSSFVPAADLLFEHRTYFPLACLTIAAAALAPKVHGRLRAPVIVLLLAALLTGTILRNRVWRDDFSLWSDVVRKSPGKARGYFQLAQAIASQDAAHARRLYERGLEIEPENAAGRTNLGLMALSQGDIEAALSHLRRALALNGDRALIWNNIGVAELRRGEAEQGIGAFRRALEINPCRFDARWNLTHTLAYAGMKQEALAASHAPPGCDLLPEQMERLEAERRALE